MRHVWPLRPDQGSDEGQNLSPSHAASFSYTGKSCSKRSDHTNVLCLVTAPSRISKSTSLYVAALCKVAVLAALSGTGANPLRECFIINWFYTVASVPWYGTWYHGTYGTTVLVPACTAVQAGTCWYQVPTAVLVRYRIAVGRERNPLARPTLDVSPTL